MRLKTLVLCSSSAAILAFAGTPALAQSDPVNAARSDRRGAGIARRSRGGLAADRRCGRRPRRRTAEGETRSSSPAFAAASSRRRTSSAILEQIVDAIVAEDIGKLPDIAVSDTAARIPGIQVERDRRRGEPGAAARSRPDYYTTTYNGREIFTAETRSVALQDFPAGGDQRDRGVQDVDRQPRRAGPRRPDQRPLAPAVRFQGLRDRRLGLGALSQPVAGCRARTRSC